jgi:uncharacterized phage-associated protein
VYENNTATVIIDVRSIGWALYTMDINLTKYKNAILYFSKYCNNQYLGVTKLNKLLYYLDFISYRDRKTLVTNDVYVHKEYGPVPARVDDVLGELRESGDLDIRNIPYGDGYKAEFVVKTDPDLSVFNNDEKVLLTKICKEFALWSTSKIVNQTHLEAPWFFSDPYEKVDYEYATDIDFFTDREELIV